MIVALDDRQPLGGLCVWPGRAPEAHALRLEPRGGEERADPVGLDGGGQVAHEDGAGLALGVQPRLLVAFLGSNAGRRPFNKNEHTSEDKVVKDY